MFKDGKALTPASTEIEKHEGEAQMPAVVKRKVSHPIMTADPDLSHLTPEQQAKYWKRRHDELLVKQQQEYESKVHEETLRLINFTSASSDTASLYLFTDTLASYFPLLSPEKLDAVRSMPKFKPTPRVIPMYEAPGFKVGVQKQA
jgi:hypothetical protein